MDINTVKSNIDKMTEKINNVNMMIKDYENCSSEMSKKVLEAAICKIGRVFDVELKENSGESTVK